MNREGKLFFASDVHLGLFPENLRIERERKFVSWLESVRHEAKAIYLLGDIFDIWYEFPKVAPQGFVRTLGKIAEICDSGVEVHFFRGNHDGWICKYLCQETGMIYHKEETIIECNGKVVLLGHGDGLGKEYSYHLLKWFLNSGFTKFLLSKVFHPALSLFIFQNVSKHNRLAKGMVVPFMGNDKEDQIVFSNKELSKHHIDYFIFGHRHLATNIPLSQNSRYICLGEWVNLCSYAVINQDGTIELKYY